MADKDCELCGGTGYIRYNVPINHPDFGRLFLCPLCSKPQSLIEHSGLELGEMGFTLNSLIITDKKAFELIKQFVTRKYGLLFLWGYYGVGKTRLMKTIVAEIASGGEYARYTTATEIVEMLRKFEEPPAWLKYPVLCIDEFDKIRGTEFAEEQIFQVFNDRYNKAILKGGLTIIGSNKEPSKFSPGIQDRLRDGRVTTYQIKGKSIRPAMTDEDIG